MEGLRMSTENSEYKDSGSVSQDKNPGHSRYEAEVVVSHYEI
jgi:hypothetical protein